MVVKRARLYLAESEDGTGKKEGIGEEVCACDQCLPPLPSQVLPGNSDHPHILSPSLGFGSPLPV